MKQKQYLRTKWQRIFKTDKEKLNSHVSIKGNGFFIKNVPTNKTQSTDGFIAQLNHSNKFSENRKERYTSKHVIRLTFL